MRIYKRQGDKIKLGPGVVEQKVSTLAHDSPPGMLRNIYVLCLLQIYL